MKKRIRIQGTIVSLAVILIIFLPKRIFFSQFKNEVIDELLDFLGVGLILYGFLFRIVARGYKEYRSFGGKSLVSDGPYRLIQNPMYFGTFLIGTGIIFVLFGLWTFLLFMIIYLSIYIPQIKKENETLSMRFGQEYKDYCKKTPKYFPNIYYLLNFKDYIFLRLSWIKKEITSFVVVMVSILTIEIWQDKKLFSKEGFLGELIELSFIISAFFLIIFLFVRTNKENQKFS